MQITLIHGSLKLTAISAYLATAGFVSIGLVAQHEKARKLSNNHTNKIPGFNNFAAVDEG